MSRPSAPDERPRSAAARGSDDADEPTADPPALRQGTGETRVRGGNGVNIHSTGSGTGASSILRFSAGDETLKTGGVTVVRQDPTLSHP